jgi:hypothetical protein
MSLVVNILALIGLLIIVVYIIYFLVEYIKRRRMHKINMAMNPPSSYMQNSGLKCPDYWVNTGIDSSGNYICKNSFNVKTHNPNTGVYKGKCDSKIMTFSPIDPGHTWEYGNPNGLKSYSRKGKYQFLNNNVGSNAMSRCAWINNCGPTPTTQGVWQGVDDICNNSRHES